MSVVRAIDTLSARIFLILLLGVTLAALAGGEWAEQLRGQDVRHVQAARAIERLSGLLTTWQNLSPARRLHEAEEYGSFIRTASSADGPGVMDAQLSALMQRQLPSGIAVSVATLPLQRCAFFAEDDDEEDRHEKAASIRKAPPAWHAAVETTACLRMHLTFHVDGSSWDVVTAPPPLLRPEQGVDAGFLGVLGVATALLALLVARIAVAPVRTLARAAAAFDAAEEVAPLRESGPSDVRQAIRSFNDMRRRLARHAAEQAHMIAAITHDLQTPMTRMRLKFEAIEDEAMRQRLLADWHAMRLIVEEGLELARSSHLREAAVLLDVDSLIESIVEDEVEAGHVATFAQAAGRDLRCRPQMLRRCIQNLVDNAQHYGGRADLVTRADADGFRIEIRDGGPGIPDESLDAVFEPMVRLETSRSRDTGGTGLGLTIARILARRNDATISLANLPSGGLAATIHFPRPGYE